MLRKQDQDILICDDMHLTFNAEPSLRIKGEKQKKQKKKKDPRSMNPFGREAQKTSFSLYFPPAKEREDLQGFFFSEFGHGDVCP